MTMSRINHLVLIALACAGAAGVLQLRLSAQQAKPAAAAVTVTLCDGKTEMTVPGLKPGEKLDRSQAQAVANLFLGEWEKRNPESPWLLAQNAAQAAKPTPPAAAPAKQAKPAPRPTQSEIYNRFTERDKLVWQLETEKFVKEGNRIFHDADAFGGTIGVSCDMCHPNASNTHPETYPKYQVQLQRVALLRDMINWCIQNPTKGKPLADDDPRLRAMEAYILSQHSGKAIEPGKH
jgi:thiosulfate dehydrogenase